MEERKKKPGPEKCEWTGRHIGHELHTLDMMIGRLVNAYQSKVDEKAGINRMQGWIIGYLYRHSDEDVFQKDLEAEFQMARSTASGILQSMEKKELITRESIPRDARLKRLVLTPKGMEFQMEIIDNFARIQKALSANISAEQLDEFYETADIIRENVTNACREAGEIYPCNSSCENKNKE